MNDPMKDKPEKSISPPDMLDRDDRELHSAESEHPYPKPAKTKVEGAKTKVEGKTQDDTADPGDTDPDAPHDRGTVRDGKYERGIQSMQRKVDDDKGWREGKTQD